MNEELSPEQQKLLEILSATNLGCARFEPITITMSGVPASLAIWLEDCNIGVATLDKFKGKEYVELSLYDTSFFAAEYAIRWFDSIESGDVNSLVEEYLTELHERCKNTARLAEGIKQKIVRLCKNSDE